MLKFFLLFLLCILCHVSQQQARIGANANLGRIGGASMSGRVGRSAHVAKRQASQWLAAANNPSDPSGWMSAAGRGRKRQSPWLSAAMNPSDASGWMAAAGSRGGNQGRG